MSLHLTCLRSLFALRKHMVLAEGKKAGFNWRGLMVQVPALLLRVSLCEERLRKVKSSKSKACKSKEC